MKVEPRSKNAIAAGLSSFTNDAASSKLKNDQGMAAFTHAINKKNKAKAGGVATVDLPRQKIAAEQTGRNAFLMELDAPYADVVVDRYQRFSGKPAILERTGESPIPMGVREEKMR